MAALARKVTDTSSACPARHDTRAGLRVLVFESAAPHAHAIDCALRANPNIRSITHTPARPGPKSLDEAGAAPDFAILELRASSESGFAAMIELGAKLNALYALPQTAGIPVVVLTPAASHDCNGAGKARGDIVDVAARLDGIINELAPRAKRS
jgi:Asp/Glu/hydantoin racemase